MSTVTRPSFSSRVTIVPRNMSNLNSRFSASALSIAKRVTQRAPLPQCSTSPPSAL
jgi:hypothetical protein